MPTSWTIARDERAISRLEAGFASRLFAAAVYAGNRAAAALAEMLERRHSRLVLLSLTDEQLKDIGLSRADAEREGLRNPWE
ncbi:DUF1127 domain-containing protein [Pseudaminobacter sp. 19-2017]|uniref:DUF1127 domain-containing protein n=1 Tax=Pseudaminobacter soli (ex Zhang et al. 2022) TaxID=2831468 RepID=A0A942I6M7_9HYPH|nr:DUF1127 domain-containing protein [Pseudaminobacter soli]